MGRKRIKQYLTLLFAIGVIAVVANGGGTFASFNAQVTNPGNTFASGTLFLHDTTGGTTCKSESANSANGGNNTIDGTGTDFSGADVCKALFPSVDLSTAPPWTANLALNNAGTALASNVEFDVSNCTVSTNTATSSTVTFGTTPGCGDFYITIQQNQDGNFNSNSFCAYGPGTLATACLTPASSINLGSPSSLTPLQMDNGSGSATPATLAGGATKFYTISIAPNPAMTGNTLQNRLLTFDMDWQLSTS